jgi:hydroxypyruvate reductase
MSAETSKDTILVFTSAHPKLPEQLGLRWNVIMGVPQLPELSPEELARVRVIVQAGSHKTGAAEMDRYPNLGRIVTTSAGYEGVDAEAAKARGIDIRTGVGANAEDVADMAVALTLAAMRRILQADAKIRSGDWEGRKYAPIRSVYQYKVGIVGLGNIGKAIAERLKVFKCPIAWTGPRPKPDVDLPYVPSLLELAKQSDVLIVAAHLDASTRKMISREVIEALGPEGILVNVGRGGLVDEDELIAALRDGRLGAAALDVFEKEPTPAARWADVPNTILSPHVAAVTHGAFAKTMGRALGSVTEFLDKA